MVKLRPTIEEVARIAGVSPATVSRVLNGTARVTPEKRKAVLRAIETLGYRPSLAAQTLARGRSYAVGILVPDFSSPFYGPILEAITLELEATPFRPITVPGHWSLVRELEALEFLKNHQLEALLLLGTSLDEKAVKPLGVPVLAFGQVLEGAWSLMVDNRRAAYQATRYLLELGHTRIAHITSQRGGMDVQERLLGYRKAMREAGLEARVVYGNLQEDGGYRACRELFRRYPDTTAIFAANDQTAIGARLYLYEQGVSVPQEVSLVGFDDIPSAAYQIPPLTTVRQPLQEIGHALGQAVKALLEGHKPELPALELHLVPRQSTKGVRS